MGSAKWDRRFLRLAQEVASWSKDPSTKVGSVIVDADRRVLSLGYNGFPRGIADTDARLSVRADKYEMVVHAELNAIFNASRYGVPINGNTMYITMSPCSSCALAIIQSGIGQVFWPAMSIPARWRESMVRSLGLLKEAGVAYDAIKCPPLGGKGSK